MKEVETGFYSRAALDAELAEIVGKKSNGHARVFPGWPDDMLNAEAYPRLTYFVAADAVIRPGFHRVTLQTDLWVWPGGGARDRVTAADRRLLALFDEQHWKHDDAQLSATALPARDMPAGPDAPLRRRRDFTFLALAER